MSARQGQVDHLVHGLVENGIFKSHRLGEGAEGLHVRAALAKSGWGALNIDGVMKTVAFIVISPVLGFVLGSCFMLGISWIFFRVPPSRAHTKPATIAM